MTILQFPAMRSRNRGTVHVTDGTAGGFVVAHESASGDSWGHFSEHASGFEAIVAAYALNRDELGGECDVFVCDAALRDQESAPSRPSSAGDF